MNMPLGINQGGLLRRDTCSTCPKKIRLPDGSLECHAVPPVMTPILAANAQGKPEVVGQVNAFPKVEHDWFCWQHPALLVRAAVGQVYVDAETNGQ